jgi:hypothetical protein
MTMIHNFMSLSQDRRDLAELFDLISPSDVIYCEQDFAISPSSIKFRIFCFESENETVACQHDLVIPFLDTIEQL